MPATHLISVDLPAPLSPTSAITSPARTSKSASRSACTAPKCLETSRSSSVGWAVAFTRPGFYHGGGAPSEAPPPRFGLLAVLPVDAVADLAALQEAVLEQLLVVRLRDPQRSEQDRLRPADLAVRLDRAALDDVDRRLRRGVRLEPHRLVDGAA